MILTFIKFSDSDKKCGNESQKTLLVHSKWLQDQRWVFSRAPRWVNKKREILLIFAREKIMKSIYEYANKWP